MKKKILLLGATGSIGTNTCSVVREFCDDFEIVGMSTNSKIDVLRTLCIEFKPKAVNISDKSAANIFKDIFMMEALLILLKILILIY